MSETYKRQWSVLSWLTLIGVGMLLSVQLWTSVGRMLVPAPYRYDALIVPGEISPGAQLTVTGTVTKSRDCAGTSSMRVIDSANVFHELFLRSVGARPPSTYDFSLPLTAPADMALGPATFVALVVSNCHGDDYVERVTRDVMVVPSQ